MKHCLQFQSMEDPVGSGSTPFDISHSRDAYMCTFKILKSQTVLVVAIGIRKYRLRRHLPRSADCCSRRRNSHTIIWNPQEVVGTVLVNIKLTKFAVRVRFRCGSGKLKLCRYFTMFCDICFKIFKNVVHSLKPGETPRHSASHQASNYVQRF